MQKKSPPLRISDEEPGERISMNITFFVHIYHHHKHNHNNYGDG